MRRWLCALAALASISSAEARKPPAENTPALVSIAIGALGTVVGAIVVGYGSTIRAGGNCPGYAMSAEVCDGLRRDYSIAGWTLFAAGLTVSLGGSVALGVQAR